MTTNTRKLAAGGVLLLVSSFVIIALSVTDLPVVAGAVAALGLAAGTLLVGTSEGGRPV